MYYFCPDGIHSCDCREPPASHAVVAQQQLQQPLVLHHDQSTACGCRGVWIYVCYQHIMDPAAAYSLQYHRLPSPSPCCCRSPSNNITHMPPHLQVTDDVQKLKKPFTDDKPTVRVYCKAQTDFSLTIRDAQIILAPTNPDNPHQHWIKDEKFGINVKDEKGHSSFALVNKATGQAMKHSIGVKYPVQLTEYNPDKLDESLLWTLSNKIFRPIGNFDLHLDAYKGVEEHGGVKDGTKIVLWDWNGCDNQNWTIISY